MKEEEEGSGPARFIYEARICCLFTTLDPIGARSAPEVQMNGKYVLLSRLIITH